MFGVSTSSSRCRCRCNVGWVLDVDLDLLSPPAVRIFWWYIGARIRPGVQLDSCLAGNGQGALNSAEGRGYLQQQQSIQRRRCSVAGIDSMHFPMSQGWVIWQCVLLLSRQLTAVPLETSALLGCNPPVAGQQYPGSCFFGKCRLDQGWIQAKETII